MQIKALSVEGVGRFAAAAHVQGFQPGVNVLAAGNEMGKSTLFRALRACLFARHDSKTQEIRDLASDDVQLPVVIELAFAHEGANYVIKKSFLRSPSATLVRDGREIARGKQADDAVWSILGVGPGTGKSLDDGAFGMLWVQQGGSLATPVPGPGASSVLTAIIESEVGAVVGGERARQVTEAVTTELKRQFTDSGKVKSDSALHRAIENAKKWNACEADLEGKLAVLEAQFNDLRERRRQYTDLTNPVTVQELARDLANARSALSDAQSAAQELRRFEAEELSARRDWEAAGQRAREHRELINRIADARRAELAQAEAMSELEGREAEARTALARTALATSALDQTATSLAVREQSLAKLTAAVASGVQKDALKRQIEQLERTAGALRDIEAQLAQISIDQGAMDRLTELDRRLIATEAQLSAAAAKLTVDLRADGAGHVEVDGKSLEGTYAGSVTEAVRIKVGALAEITVTPAPNPGRQKHKELNEQLTSLLSTHNLGSCAEAHAHLTKRRELEAEVKALRSQLGVQGSATEVHGTVGDLKQQLARDEAAIAVALREAGLARLPTSDALAELRTTLDQERAALDAMRASLDEARGVQQSTLENALGARKGAESKLEILRSNVARDEALSPSEDRAAKEVLLHAELVRAETAHRTAHATFEARRLACPDIKEVERRQTRCSRLEQAVTNRNQETTKLAVEIAQLSAHIQAAGGDGIGEALAIAREERLSAEVELQRMQNRVAALQLLRETVTRALAEGRERYYEPVRRHLRPFLDDLFPGAELELGDDFEIAGIKRDRSEPLWRLSDGTKEQIAVLVRLALGAMLAEQGKSVPVILDDALVYCDDDRIQLMFDALNRAGSHQQVIVLTCRSRTFATLGGHALRLHHPAGGVADLQHVLRHGRELPAPKPQAHEPPIRKAESQNT